MQDYLQQNLQLLRFSPSQLWHIDANYVRLAIQHSEIVYLMDILQETTINFERELFSRIKRFSNWNSNPILNQIGEVTVID